MRNNLTFVLIAGLCLGCGTKAPPEAPSSNQAPHNSTVTDESQPAAIEIAKTFPATEKMILDTLNAVPGGLRFVSNFNSKDAHYFKATALPVELSVNFSSTGEIADTSLNVELKEFIEQASEYKLLNKIKFESQKDVLMLSVHSLSRLLDKSLSQHHAALRTAIDERMTDPGESVLFNGKSVTSGVFRTEFGNSVTVSIGFSPRS